jgi:hypothetical protein
MATSISRGHALLLAALLPLAVANAGPEPAATASAPVLYDGIEMDVSALGQVRYSGAFAGMADDQLRLSTPDGVVEVPMPVIEQVTISGVVYGPDEFSEGLRRWGQQLLDEVARVPHPALVGGLSVVWSGAGPAALGDWKGALSYTLLEGCFVGAGAVMVIEEQYGPLLPLAALDLLLHVWAVSDSVRESKRRRARAALAVGPLALPAAGSEHPMGLGFSVTFGPPPGNAAKGTWTLDDSCTEMGLTGACSFPY